MSKYTKGPWKIGEWGEVLTSQKDDYGRPEIVLLTGISMTSGNHPRQKEVEANSRLIASAPELLEALKEALLEHSCDWNGCWCEKAREAIHKSEGRE